jgi:drug/metabolite transporter (DMT)-like permease
MSAVDPAGFPSEPQPPAITPEAARRTRLIAIGLMCGGLLCFAFLDAVAKYLGRTYDPVQIAWIRYASHLVIAIVIVNPMTMPGAWRSNRPVLQFFRSVLLAGTTTLNFMALQTLRMDETMSIVFVTPLLVAIFAGPLLGEWVGPRRLAAIMVGFAGVLLVTRPGIGEWQDAYLYAMANSVCYAFYNILTRMVGGRDSVWTSFFYLPMFGMALLAPMLPAVWVWPHTTFDITFLIMTGALGGFGHLMLIIAHARAPAGILAPFMFTQIVWMIALGWFVFGDTPDLWTLSGATIVISSGLYLFARERTVKSASDL